MDFDDAWCPVCDRQIIPKRNTLPQQQQDQPPPPPSSPQPSPKATTRKATRGATIRARQGGLVHGTGRVKPNGALKRSDSTKTQPLPAPLKPTQPLRQRTVIDQSPIPLYCSDECQIADLNNGALPLDFNPNRQSTPHPIEKTYSCTTSETESESATSVDSEASTQLSPSIATLSAIYHFPPLPPPPVTYEEHTSSSDSDYPHDYTSGVMMAGKRIQAHNPKPPKRSPYDFSAKQHTRPTVPGWNDGSNEWRASVYSFSKDTSDPLSSDVSKAYKSFTASPHRSRGVPTMISEGRTAAAPTVTEELVTKFAQSLGRRSESRSSSSSVPAARAQRKERSLLKPGAEGKLLVPDVKLKVRNGSNASLASSWSVPQIQAQEPQRCESAMSLPSTRRRPAAETRSWSYDNLKTYPILQISKKEKRLQTQIVEGVEIQVEIEVEVHEERKRLFNFPAPWDESQRTRPALSDD
ncbi:hypothetical protein BDN72DRAFT_853819 [Pluteus cervinus]|uniref:Uncharacterized protein n=1 Tax=Pluteus cervinus TaxID=181527 RepID=A0ACD3BAR9_9AGAR|nr:hypothetical protein BDN72DRAFT_853819 [Pluteus cervinus]